MSAGCGASWAPLNTPQGYQDSVPFPGHRRNCAGHGNELLNQLCLEGGGPHSSPRAKSMQSVMELDGRQWLAVDNSGYRLPQDLHQSNTPKLGASSLGDHHHRLLGARRRELSSPEVRLYDGGNLLPVPRFGFFLPLCRAMPHSEVFGLHS